MEENYSLEKLIAECGEREEKDMEKPVRTRLKLTEICLNSVPFPNMVKKELHTFPGPGST